MTVCPSRRHLSYLPWIIALLFLNGCGSYAPDSITGRPIPSRLPETLPDATATALTTEQYKRVLADRIASTNSLRMFIGRPQALLRSVIVIKYQVDGEGNLQRTEVMRSNGDRAAERTALDSLRAAAPFPRPASHLLKARKIELMETWLFNNDGRFQLRTTAERQMDQ